MSYFLVPSQKLEHISHEDYEVDLKRLQPRTRLYFVVVAWIVATNICVMGLGIYIGYSHGVGNTISPSTNTRITQDTPLAPAGRVSKIPIYNHTFSDPPTVASEAAWNDLAPLGGGFVTHPVHAPKEAAVAVFHQLHCLHGIRLTLYFALAQTNETLWKEVGDQINQYGLHDLQHTVHCIEYIRQALMCAADSNLEVLNPSTDHVDAFGSVKQCRDLNALTDWAIRWRTTNRTGILTKPSPTP